MATYGRGRPSLRRRLAAAGTVIAVAVVVPVAPSPASAASPQAPVLVTARAAAASSSLVTMPLDPSTASPSGGATVLEQSSTDVFRDLALSPDGTRLAYVQEAADGSTSVKVRALDGGAPMTLADGSAVLPPSGADAGCSAASPCDVGQPAWTGDGTAVVLTRFGPDTGTEFREARLLQVPAAGGAVSAVAGGADASHAAPLPDGSGVVAVDEDPDAPVRLLRISTAGARSVIAGGLELRDPAVSPDGAWIAAAAPTGVWSDGIVVLPSSGGTATAITTPSGGPDTAVFDAAPSWSSDSVRVFHDRTTIDAAGTRVSVRSVTRAGLASADIAAPSGTDEGYPVVAGGDATPPVAWITAPTAPALGAGAVGVAWTARDPGLSGVAGYDVRYRTISPSGTYSAFATWRTGTASTSASFGVRAGLQYCWSVRATDADGNVGLWSAERCATVPIDDASLAASRGWTRWAWSGFAGGAARQTTVRGATLSTGTARFKQVGVVVRTCSTCGSVSVMAGTSRIGVVKTRSTTARTIIVWTRASTSATTATVRLVAAGDGKVTIDGLALRRW